MKIGDQKEIRGIGRYAALGNCTIEDIEGGEVYFVSEGGIRDLMSKELWEKNGDSRPEANPAHAAAYSIDRVRLILAINAVDKRCEENSSLHWPDELTEELGIDHE